MNDLQIFKNQNFGEVRCIMYENKPYFVASDVAKILGYKRPNDAITQYCRYTVIYRIPHPQSSTKKLKVMIIPESDVWRLIIKSNLPKAEKIEKWVMEEVLPTIRKTGSYSIDDRNSDGWGQTRLDGKYARKNLALV